MATQEVRVTLYRITGKQLFFKINSRYCRECDLTVSVVERALRELKDVRAKLEVKPWLNYLAFSIFRGGYHPPVLLIENKMISQGVVPTGGQVKDAIIEAWERKTRSPTRTPNGKIVKS